MISDSVCATERIRPRNTPTHKTHHTKQLRPTEPGIQSLQSSRRNLTPILSQSVTTREPGLDTEYSSPILQVLWLFLTQSLDQSVTPITATRVPGASLFVRSLFRHSPESLNPPEPQRRRVFVSRSFISGTTSFLFSFFLFQFFWLLYTYLLSYLFPLLHFCLL